MPAGNICRMPASVYVQRLISASIIQIPLLSESNMTRTIGIVLTGILILSGSLAAQEESPPLDSPMDPCPFLGIYGDDARFAASSSALPFRPGEGALVVSVILLSGAHSAGVVAGDIVVSFAGARVRGITHLRQLVRSSESGEEIPLEIVRGGERIRMNATLGSNPSARPCDHDDAIVDIAPLPMQQLRIELDSVRQRVVLQGKRLRSYLSIMEDSVASIGRMRFLSLDSTNVRLGYFADSLKVVDGDFFSTLRWIDADLARFDTCRLSMLSRREKGDTVFTRLFRRFNVDDRGRFGVRVQSIPDQLAEYFRVPETHTGILVTEVKEGSAASAAGVQAGDVIIEIDGEPVEKVTDLAARLQRDTSSGVSIRIVRDGALIDLKAGAPSLPSTIERSGEGSRRSDIFAR